MVSQSTHVPFEDGLQPDDTQTINPVVEKTTRTGTSARSLSVTLRINGKDLTFILSTDRSLVLGRSDVASGHQPDIDLAPYGAMKHGISREHVLLILQRGSVFVADLGSSNGTWVSDRPLRPYDPERLRDGDLLRLGSLEIGVRFDDRH
jgi:pSer/pThr/pTyr-binding forkhead associated (FHA) protein